MISIIENIGILPEEPQNTMQRISDCRTRISKYGLVNIISLNTATLDRLLEIKNFKDFFDPDNRKDSKKAGSLLGSAVVINTNLPDNIVQFASGFPSDELNEGAMVE